jgi:hypothetical protein
MLHFQGEHEICIRAQASTMSLLSRTDYVMSWFFKKLICATPTPYKRPPHAPSLLSVNVTGRLYMKLQSSPVKLFDRALYILLIERKE